MAKTPKKSSSIRWDDDLKAIIQKYADEEELNFSVAAQKLIRKGLEEVAFEQEVINRAKEMRRKALDGKQEGERQAQ